MKQKESFLIKLYEIFTPRERMQTGLLFIASLITAFAQAFGIASIFPFINVVMKPESIQQNKWLSLLYERAGFTTINSFILFLGIAVFLIVVLSSMISAVTTWGKTKFVLGKNHTLSRRLLGVYLSQPYEFFLQKNTNELGKNVLSEINQLTSQLLISIFDILINGLMVIVIIAMLFLVDVTVTLGAIIFLGGSYGLINYLIKKRLEKSGRERLKANKERFRMANEALSSIKTTKVMGIESFFLKNYSFHSSKFARHNIFAHVAGELPRYILEAIAFGGIIFFIIFMIARGESVVDFIPLLGLYAFAAYRMMPALHRFFNSLTKVYYNTAIVDKIYEDMIEIQHKKQSSVSSKQIKKEINFQKAIKLKDIRFCYTDNSFDVISKINLTIPKNSFIGFAGATGCGKTTLVDIILGLLTPQSGQIIVDNTPINQENIQSWQQKIGYVPQEIYLSDDSVRKNIAFGVSDKDIDDKQVKLAARIAALDAFIENELPRKYNTIIGERGIRLSGGQRQRIGLARALYRNPEILVLDEATSSLDGATEEAVLKAIHHAAEARTVIMIAHRLNTLKDCDQIYIMEKGRIIGQGNYEELLKQSRKFREMAKMPEK
jgi:ATP-binding cassette, subfamily B, bacterial PglK